MAQNVNPVDPDSDEGKEVVESFDDNVNMSPKALEEWLATDESQSVGQKEGDESVGHEMGRHIVAILQKKKSDYTGEDVARMKKVNGYVSRHLKQGGPDSENDVKDSKWRYSLMNWGHDPLKD